MLRADILPAQLRQGIGVELAHGSGRDLAFGFGMGNPARWLVEHRGGIRAFGQAGHQRHILGYRKEAGRGPGVTNQDAGNQREA